MHELAPGYAKEFRKSLLLCTVSMTCLLAMTVVDEAIANEEASNPTVWIELGAQLQQSGRTSDLFSPAFTSNSTASGFDNPVGFEKFPRYSIGGEGKLVFSPRGSDWVFTASVSYGRANGQKHVHEQQTIPPTPNPLLGGTIVPTLAKFVDTQNRYSSSHNVLDFRVGRDVGVGLFGGAISSQLSLGVRSAVFTSRSKVHISGHPDFHFIKNPPKYFPHVGGHEYYASAVESQSFHGIGPSISWEASAPLGRSKEDSRLSVDWGIDAAVLFGRQRASSHHHTSASYYQVPPIKYPGVALYNMSGGSQRSKSVVVPSLGGFAALSFRYSNAKVSFGYRAEKYFAAMDGGMDVRKTYDQNFFGPYATISIGIGG